jgi:hypothetical protein
VAGRSEGEIHEPIAQSGCRGGERPGHAGRDRPDRSAVGPGALVAPDLAPGGVISLGGFVEYYEMFATSYVLPGLIHGGMLSATTKNLFDNALR